VGLLLLTRYDLVFELISLVLLVAIIGAILTAGYSRRLSQ
jgi:NADH-quinone oxidoreductase subunit J